MNPRHRRLVIPVALVALLVIVVVAAILKSSSTTESLADGLARIRDHLLDPDSLVRGLGSGRQKGQQPRWRRAELRWVDLKAGRHLQVTTYDATQAFVANHPVGDAAGAAVDALLAEPFGNWHVETTTEVHQLRVTKKLDAITHTSGRAAPVEAVRAHDREKERLLPADDPVLVALGLADAEGRIKPSRQAKYRQVEEFVRILDTSITEALGNQLRTPTPDDPLRIVDLGCGNGYLTFAAHRFLTEQRGLPVRLIGVDVKQQSAEHNAGIAAELSIDADFVVGSIDGATLPERDRRPDVVLALHACDTATDEALARAVEWQAPLVLAAPCCHHDIAAQLRARRPTPTPYTSLTRHGILRERFADTLTDALREMLLRLPWLPCRRHAVRREPAHAPQHPAARGADRRRRGSRAAAGVRRPRRELAGQPAPRRPARRLDKCDDQVGRVSRLEKILAALAVLPFGLGFAVSDGASRTPPWCSPSPTPRSSSRADWSSRTACSRRSTTPATAGGCSPSTPPTAAPWR